MPLDAYTLGAVRAELEQRCVDMKIDKVAMPSRDEIVLTLRGRAGGGKLLLSANSASPRACMTTASRENPATPPMFCMLLRKLIGGGVIRAVTQPTAERMLVFDIEATDEMGELRTLRLAMELINRRANLVLIDEEGRITDAIRRVDGDLAEGKRQVLPGLFYRPPEAREGIDPMTADEDSLRAFALEIPCGADITEQLLNGLRGISPLVCRELAHRAGDDRESLAREIISLRATECEPWIVLKDGVPKDFSAMCITQYGAGWECEKRESFSELLEEFFGERERAEQVRSAARDMTGTVTTALERTRRKLNAQRRELSEARDRERLRENGDLLMANLHLIGRGAAMVTVDDFYAAEEGATRNITLDPKIGAQQNAARCYREYTKKKNAEKMLTGLIAEGEREEQYLGSALDELRRAESKRELEDIRAELAATGYIKRGVRAQRRGQKPQPPREFMSSGGFRIQVGRNNLQNDELTLRQSHKNDVWLHAQHSHGAHVLIRCGQTEPDDATYTEAAMLAAYYSEARGSSGVAVDYTRARYVKKPAGARPGMVVYDPYYTMYVTPDADIVERLSAER